MKTHIISLLSIFFLTACTVPSPSDFETTTKPLNEEEFLVVWRFSRTAKEWEVLDKSQEHKIEMEAAMEPLFQQLIPQIFSDIKEGKLLIREQEDITELDETPIKDISSILGDYYEGSWQNLAPFMQTFHITQRRNVFTAGFPAVPLELELIAQDPNDNFPERRLGSVSVEDLLELGYFIEVEGQKYDLIAYLDKTIQYGYPISYFYEHVENGLRTLAEAFGTKEYLLEGKWMSIPWLAGEANISGQKMASISKTELELLRGEYYFPDEAPKTEAPINRNGLVKVFDFFTEPSRNHFYPHEKYTYLSWAYKGEYSSFFSLGGNSFFAPSGERIRFTEMGDGEMQISIIYADGKEIVGYRE